MIIDGKRALAYSATIDNIQPIDGADRIELAFVKGWPIIVKKEEFQIGDLCVFFEIDSKLPEADWSEFLKDKHYKVKIYKLKKFGVISEGLALPYSTFPEDVRKNLPLFHDVDVTELLNVTYIEQEDNIRKSENNTNKKRNSFLMRYKWYRKLFCKKHHKKSNAFPTHFPYIKKTDEERVENMPFLFSSNKINRYIVTEKLDGTSCTYILERLRRNKFEFYVCSRNIRYKNIEQKTYHDFNIYWYLANKYEIRNCLENYLREHKNLKYVCIQGEGVGKVQGNPLKLNEPDLYVFNFIDSENGRYNAINGQEIINKMGMKWVPILDNSFVLPSTLEELKIYSDGNSVINPNVLREGIVLRDIDTDFSFKSVSREYLLKHN